MHIKSIYWDWEMYNSSHGNSLSSSLATVDMFPLKSEHASDSYLTEDFS